MEYVTAEQLAGFSKYKYSAVDSNPLSLYVMHPFWNTVVKIFPTWLAPNLITFSGFLLLVFNFFLMAYFDPDFYASAPDHQHVPSGVWIIVGLLNFMAYTLDGVDGKQARRTNSSTPLGELFDHGLDSWACVYFVVTVYSTFGRGSTGVSVFVLYLLLWVVLFSFILSHWEKYNTGILFLPWGYDISQVVSTDRGRSSASAEPEHTSNVPGVQQCRPRGARGAHSSGTCPKPRNWVTAMLAGGGCLSPGLVEEEEEEKLSKTCVTLRCNCSKTRHVALQFYCSKPVKSKEVCAFSFCSE
ncbi:hypothetical protein AV530_009677 [Patagioenas fasciata monilis]|uniref:Ethanolaminephosphotransferase 1 n=1 Tax=Patagioenas fasciata monilis TaxID=372326 RepID=A0A1V4K9S9_PATFA|nr:hypothetical protein AV530_009677 [Patagioenas fasciata monilis]